MASSSATSSQTRKNLDPEQMKLLCLAAAYRDMIRRRSGLAYKEPEDLFTMTREKLEDEITNKAATWDPPLTLGTVTAEMKTRATKRTLRIPQRDMTLHDEKLPEIVFVCPTYTLPIGVVDYAWEFGLTEGKEDFMFDQGRAGNDCSINALLKVCRHLRIGRLSVDQLRPEDHAKLGVVPKIYFRALTADWTEMTREDILKDRDGCSEAARDALCDWVNDHPQTNYLPLHDVINVALAGFRSVSFTLFKSHWCPTCQTLKPIAQEVTNHSRHRRVQLARPLHLLDDVKATEDMSTVLTRCFDPFAARRDPAYCFSNGCTAQKAGENMREIFAVGDRLPFILILGHGFHHDEDAPQRPQTFDGRVEIYYRDISGDQWKAEYEWVGLIDCPGGAHYTAHVRLNDIWVRHFDSLRPKDPRRSSIPAMKNGEQSVSNIVYRQLSNVCVLQQSRAGPNQ